MAADGALVALVDNTAEEVAADEPAAPPSQSELELPVLLDDLPISMVSSALCSASSVAEQVVSWEQKRLSDFA